MLLGVLSIAHGQPSSAIRIAGTVISAETGHPLEGATITLKTGTTGVLTDEGGKFILSTNLPAGEITVSHVGYRTQTIRFSPENKGPFTIRLERDEHTLEEVQINTGYQTLSKQSMTGSADHVSNALLNRAVTTNIIDRLESITPGLSFNTPGESPTGNPGRILIRGRNSIHSSVAPLIVVDNFPYDGPLESINPNDVNEISILKDAAAAAQWGARAGNGVIVITTKRGITARPRVSVNSNSTLREKPDLFSIPQVSPADFIELEREQFNRGFYNGDLTRTVQPPPLTPVAELLARVRSGEMDEAAAETRLEAWKQHDLRSDLGRYLYQTAWQQQHALNVSGSADIVNYYFSAGYDRNRSELVGNSNQRVSLRSKNTFRVSSNVNLEAGIQYSANELNNGGNLGINTNLGSKSLYPYARLADEQGNPSALVRDFRMIYTDTVGQGQLADWKYRPLEETGLSETTNRNRDLVLNGGATFSFLDHFSASLTYQFQQAINQGTVLNSGGSYYTRDLINRFYQPGAANPNPVPFGGILNSVVTEARSHQARVQLNFRRNWQQHQLQAIAGWEVKDLVSQLQSFRLYGYESIGSQVNASMDFVTLFPQYVNPVNRLNIPNAQSVGRQTDRFTSAYINAQYSFRNRYIVSASAREDAANLFGVATNQRGVPLWSAGTAWLLHKEPFYRLDWLPLLKLRTSYGHSGNFSRQAAAYTTISFGTNQQRLPSASIATPPNKKLRWEQNGIFNLALDAEAAGGRLGGTVEYFRKKNTDLMAQAPIDPTLGIMVGQQNLFYGNVASVEGEGVEVTLNARPFTGRFRWDATVLFTYAQTRISDYLLPAPTTASSYVGGGLNPMVGHPMYTLYAYRWEGLDPENGDPQGYFNGAVSKDYTPILNQTSPDSLVYFGSVQPPYFGSFMHRFLWKNVSFSFNLSYAFGHYYRRNSISYTGLSASWSGHSDYGLRWQQQGDEERTQVPAYQYGAPAARDNFYQRSAVLVERAAYIRLNDLRLDYSMAKLGSLPLRDVRLYAYSTGFGLLWSASRHGNGPLAGNGPLPQKSLALGIQFSL